MKKIIIASTLLLLGFGCNQKTPVNEMVSNNNNQDTVSGEIASSTVPMVTTTAAAPKKLVVARTFTYDEIEQEDKGGVKEWMRQLARDNVAGKKTLVRMPVNHIQGFGCSVPVKYCVSAISGGCYGPYVDLKGNISALDQAPGTVWGVEGYVVAASKVPEYPGDDPRNCASNELMYDFQVTKVLNKLDPGAAEEFKFVEYK